MVATCNVRMSPEFMREFLARDQRGRRILIEWGEPGEDGFYDPRLTLVEDPFARLVEAVIAFWEHTEQHADYIPGEGYSSDAHRRPCADLEEHRRLAIAEGEAWHAYREGERLSPLDDTSPSVESP